MKTQVTKQYTREEAADLYSQLNNEGKGFAIGHDDQTVRDAIIDGGYYLACSFEGGLFHVTLDEDEFLIGGDGMGRNAWAVRV
jgi:hypothetical protein